ATPDNRANETRQVLRFAALAVVNQRLSILQHGPNPPFISASASHDHVGTVADATELIVTYRAGEFTNGVKSTERLWRDAVSHGVRQEELDQTIAQLRTFFQNNAIAAETTTTPYIANAITRSLDDNDVYTSPATDLALYNDVAKEMTVAAVSAALKDAFSGSGPFVFASSATPLAGGEAALSAALAEADNTPLAASAATSAPSWPYTSFGPSGKVVARSTVDDLGVTFLRFANGVTLTVKPTQFRAGQILLTARFGQGRLGLPRDHITPTWTLGGAFVQGGLRRYSLDDLRRRMADKMWGASLSISDDAYSLTGVSRASDLTAELQVLAAYLTDAAWQPEAFD